MSRAQGLPSNRPLPSSDVASSAPDCSASASSAWRAPERMTPRPASMIGFSASAIMSTTRVDHGGIGQRPLRHRHQLGGGRVVGEMRPSLLLQVHRHREHHRLALGLRHLEGLAHVVEHAIDVLHADIVRAAGERERRHVDLLDVPRGGERRVAREHHQRRVAARRDGERRHDLGEARPAGRRGDADLAGGAGIAVGHGDGAMLVARMHHLHAGQLRHRHRPVHVGVAHQGEQRVDALGREGAGQHVGHLQLAHLGVSLFPKRLRSHDRKARHMRLPARSSVAGGDGGRGRRRRRLGIVAAGRPLGHQLGEIGREFAEQGARDMHAAGIGESFQRPGDAEAAVDRELGRLLAR